MRVAVHAGSPPLSSGSTLPEAGKNLDCDSPATHTDIPVNILLVEDNPIDARLTRHAIEQISDWLSRVQVVDDGEKAIHFLRRQHNYEQSARPDMIILDLNLPKYDGTEVLRVIRNTEDLKALLVFIFSSSPVDVAEERMNHAKVRADRYFAKPNEVGSYSSIAKAMRDTYVRATSERNSARA